MLNKYRLIVSLLLYGVCVIVAYPYCKDFFAYDEIGYVSVTRKLAAGEYYNAINGYWSPLLSWLTLALYKTGLDMLFALRLVSILSGAGILIAVACLVRRLHLPEYSKTFILFLCIPIILSYVYSNQAADVLLCPLLLTYTYIVTAKDFFENRRKIIACAVIACMSYFAKAYAFPFFLAHFILTQVIWYYHSTSALRKKWLFRNLITGIGVFLLLAAPWIYALYHKYHLLTFGYSGKLNYYWHIYQFDPYTDTLDAIDPSPYYCLWEDPFYFPWNFKPHPPLSLALLKKQLLVLMETSKDTVIHILEISVLGMAIILSFCVYVIKKKNPVLTILFLTMIVLPAGYLLVATEYRYLYALSFILLLTGVLLLSEAWRVTAIPKAVQITGWCILAFSFLYFPISRLRNFTGNHAYIFQLADTLKQNGVKRKITTNSYQGLPDATKISFLSENMFCQLTRDAQNAEELNMVCRQKGIDYLFYFYANKADADAFRNSELYRNAVREIKNPYPNAFIIQLK